MISKISKVKYESDTEWPEKLQPAVFVINAQLKRATGLTSLRLMYMIEIVIPFQSSCLYLARWLKRILKTYNKIMDK